MKEIEKKLSELIEEAAGWYTKEMVLDMIGEDRNVSNRCGNCNECELQKSDCFILNGNRKYNQAKQEIRDQLK